MCVYVKAESNFFSHALMITHTIICGQLCEPVLFHGKPSVQKKNKLHIDFFERRRSRRLSLISVMEYLSVQQQKMLLIATECKTPSQVFVY